MEYKNDKEYGLIKKFSKKDNASIEEEEEAEMKKVKEKKTMLILVNLFNDFDGISINDSIIEAVKYITVFSMTTTKNYKSLIAKKQIFEKLFRILEISSDNEEIAQIVMNCVAVLTSKNYQDNIFFTSRLDIIENVIPLLSNENIIEPTLSFLANIINDQLICRDVFISKFSPTDIISLIEKNKENLDILYLISKIIAACNDKPFTDDEVAANMVNICKTLLLFEYDGDDNEKYQKYIIMTLFSIQRLACENKVASRMIATDEELLRKILGFIDPESIRITERVLLIIQYIAGENEFNENIIDFELLLSLRSIEDTEFRTTLTLCMSALLVNGRIFFLDNEKTEERINLLNDIISEMSFQCKEITEKNINMLIKLTPPKEVCRLIQLGLNQTLLFFIDVDTREGILAFLNLCRTILRVMLQEDKEVASFFLEFFFEEEIYEYVIEKQDSKNDKLVHNRAEVVLSAVDDLKQYIESTIRNTV